MATTIRWQVFRWTRPALVLIAFLIAACLTPRALADSPSPTSSTLLRNSQPSWALLRALPTFCSGSHQVSS